MWLNMQIFGFRALWSPYYLSFICVVALLYFLFTGPLRHYFGDVRRPSVKQQILFYSGLILVYAVKGAPVDLLSHIMMGAHMIQMALLYLLAPVWLILGIPAWMWQWFIELKYVRPVFRLFTHPLIALAGFNSLFAIYHIPVIFDFSKATPTAHIIITVGLFILACFMWWPILSPVEKYDTLQPLLKIGFLVISAFIVSIACALIIFSKEPMYQAFSSDGAWVQSLALCVPPDVLSGLTDANALSGPDMFSPLSLVEDQQLGGIVMMTVQQIIYTSMISWIFFRWFTAQSLKVDPKPAAGDLPYSVRHGK
ncbi:MAG TPA: cytochrome c oxidase assembly factor CtaG [Pseudogracilibacillus sp.]|nr:cytochrome c oxidase assembly factor CtaG [Pseudogracilibacillus sp.]